MDDRPDAGIPEPVAEIELQVAMLLRFAESSRRATTASGRLERSAYLILTILLGRGATSVNALAEGLLLNASTITRQVDAMAAAGLVERSRHPVDGRVTLVEATDLGRRAFAENRETRHRFYERVTASWDEPDRARLAELLRRLNADLDTTARAY